MIPARLRSTPGIGRPKTPPALNGDGRRRAGDYVVAAARIEAETAARAGDPLNGSDQALADSWLEAATRPLDDYVPTVIGNELMPTSLEPEKDVHVVTLQNTVSDLHYVTADASRDRVQLALLPADSSREDLSFAQMDPEAAGALQATLGNPNLTAADVPGLRVELANAAGVGEIAVWRRT